MVASTEAVVILPDWQVPLHDEKKIKAVAHFVWDFQPTLLGHVGDVTDSTQLGRWARGLRAEFDGGLEGGFAKTRELFEYYRLDYSGPWKLVKSNHDERLELAIEQRLPGLAEMTVKGSKVNIQNALDLDGFGIDWYEGPTKVAPGWMMMHGDEGGTSKIPGATALSLATAAGASVVCGHTHRAGLAWSATGIGLDRRPLAGMEVGHAMGIDRAEYLGRARLNNWGNAFGILWVHRGAKKKVEVFPQLVPIHPDGSFVVNGERYK